MKVSLITEGTYPIVQGGVSTWCDQLIRGLPDTRFEVVCLAQSGTEDIVWPLPDNVDVSVCGLWPHSHYRRNASRLPRRQQAQLSRLMDDLWLAVLGEVRVPSVRKLEVALRAIVDLLDDCFDREQRQVDFQSAASLMRVWKRAGRGLEWPELTVSAAVAAGAVVDHVLSLLTINIVKTDIVHATANGPCALVAMANRWRTGVPFLLTEHGIYVREQYMAMRNSNWEWPARRATTAFTRRVSELALQQAQVVAPVSFFNRKWELELGADPEKIVPIRHGVSSQRYPVLVNEPVTPTVSYVGRIAPLKGIETLLRAHAEVLRTIPATTLRIFGPIPKEHRDHAERMHALARELGIDDAVVWEGPIPTSSMGFEVGNVVVVPSVSEGMPYVLLEAFMSGRATVSTDVGGICECLQSPTEVGVLVPPHGVDAMASEIISLLHNDERRAAIGTAAREWALEKFSITAFLTRYNAVYELLSGTVFAEGTLRHDDDSFPAASGVGK